MLSKVLYSQVSDLYYTKFLSLQQGTLVVSGPEIADIWRQELLKADLSLSTLTYADWIKSLNLQLGLEHEEIVSKSELWDLLHRLWLNLGGNDNFNQFQNVFDLYTELKSITSDKEIFRQVLEIETTLSAELINGLVQFYDLKEINDEYQITRNLIESIEKSLDIDREIQDIHLMGFKIFSGLQVDLIRGLKKISNVFIYLPKHIQNKVSQRSLNDWPSWIEEDQTINIESHKRLQANNYMTCGVSDFSSLWESLKGKTVTLLNANDELPLSNWGQQSYSYKFKTTSDVGQAGAKEVLDELQTSLMMNNYNWEQVYSFIEKKFKNYLEEKNNYPALKWAQYIQIWLKEKCSYIDPKSTFTWLDYGVLKSKIELDAVRLFWQNFDESEDAINLNILSKGVYFYPIDENYLLLNDAIQMSSQSELLNQKSSSIIKAISPTVSDDWQRWWLEAIILDYLGHSHKNIFIINKEALQFDLFLKDFLVEYSFVKVDIFSGQGESKFQNDFLVNRSIDKKFISPSALLLYKNCPRQYYVNYIEQLPVEDQYQVVLTESKKGEIFHQLLQDIGINQNQVQLCLKDRNYLINLIQQPKYELNENEIVSMEISQIIQHTLNYWIQMPFFHSSWQIEFEKEFKSEDLKMKGRIDFVAYQQSTERLIILDFKKSYVPSGPEIERYDHWQISCYLKGWRQLHPDKEIKSILCGYWNLTDPLDSSLISNNPSDFEIPLKVEKTKIPWSTWEYDFVEHWLSYFEKLNNDKLFLPRPRSLNNCKYCILNISCSKGELA